MAQPAVEPRFRVVVLPDSTRAQLHAAAERAYPGESCGLLIGDVRAARAVVSAALPTINRAAPAGRFEIAAADVLSAMRTAHSESRVLLGAYHSHPDASAWPSATDLADAWGEWVHLITACVAGRARQTRGWQLREGRPTELMLQATECFRDDD